MKFNIYKQTQKKVKIIVGPNIMKKFRKLITELHIYVLFGSLQGTNWDLGKPTELL
jgi:hypothetical protein